MAKEFTFYGKTADELKSMSMSEFINLVPSRTRRTLKHGFTDQQKRLLDKVRKYKSSGSKKIIKTHIRDMIVLPEMIGMMLGVYNGKEFVTVSITPEMLGHFLGEFAMTRRKVQHSAPGVGATKSSSAISVR